jgi:hypothetical protein
MTIVWSPRSTNLAETMNREKSSVPVTTFSSSPPARNTPPVTSANVLLWSGTAEVGDPLVSRLWDPATDAVTGRIFDEDLFCSGHAFLPDGWVCVAGGHVHGGVRPHWIAAAPRSWKSPNTADVAGCRCRKNPAAARRVG